MIHFRRRTWSLITLRKRATCTGCYRTIEPREKAYRPLTNSMDRGFRLCLKCAPK